MERAPVRDKEIILVAPAGTIDIAPGSQLVVEVVYAPEDETADSGTFRLLSNDADEFLTIVSFAGSGALAPLPEIEVTPRSLVFGDVKDTSGVPTSGP